MEKLEIIQTDNYLFIIRNDEIIEIKRWRIDDRGYPFADYYD